MAIGQPYAHVAELVRRVAGDGLTLEVAAGSGGRYRAAAPRYVATDLPAQRRTGAGQLDLCCDARQLPFRADVFDCVFVVAALYLIDDPRMVCAEARRVLQRGGTLLVFDYTIGTKIRAWLRNRLRGQVRDFHYWPRPRLRSLLADCGFSGLECHYATPAQARIASLGPAVSDLLCQWLIFSCEKD
jgi:SAM-dependent methyltransferase